MWKENRKLFWKDCKYCTFASYLRQLQWIVMPGLMEQWKNNFEPGRPGPRQCVCIIVWAVPVRNDNRGWHWKVPEFSCLKMSLGWLWWKATQGEGRGYDKTTTLKCHRSLSHTQMLMEMCIFFLQPSHRKKNSLLFAVISKAYRQEGPACNAYRTFSPASAVFNHWKTRMAFRLQVMC